MVVLRRLPRIARSIERARIETRYIANVVYRAMVSPAQLSGRGLKQELIVLI